ncbi:MAG: hypothetical protein FJ042_02115 [Candidatus Cloacimonetes bacterium]|nr:hypothetical protein [Candidatus Cloacimonadota bacterium]
MREKYLVLILLMILSAVIFFTVTERIIDGKINKINDYDNRIKIAQEKLNSAQIQDQQLRQFEIIINNSLTKKTGFSVDEINDFKGQIGDLIHQRQISLLKLSDAPKYTLANLIENTYVIEMEATFIQTGQFISDLEALDNIIKIQAIQVRPAQISDTQKKEQTAASSRYRVVLELSVFKVKQEV